MIVNTMKRIDSKLFVLKMYTKLFGQTMNQTAKSMREFNKAYGELKKLDAKPNCSPLTW